MAFNRGRRASIPQSSKHPELPPYKHIGSHHANVYNAVAGRVTSQSVCLDDTRPAAERPPQLRHSFTNNAALAPEEALFRPSAAPVRYAEGDMYMAHDRELSSLSVLPDSDLLKAVHLYSSHYYSALRNTSTSQTRLSGHGIDENSMDETALLAFGILLEEAGRGILGRRGDLVFTEGQGEPVDGAALGHDAELPPASRSRRGSTVSLTSSVSSRRRKRQKLTDLDDD